MDTFSTINNIIFSGPLQALVIESRGIVNYLLRALHSKKNRAKLSWLIIPKNSEKEDIFMDCKFCQHPLEEGNSVCPSCGKDNAEEIMTEEVAAEEVPAAPEIPTVVDPAVAEPAPVEIKEGFQMTPGKLALTIAGAVVLTAIVIALILWGMGAKLNFGDTTEPSDEAIAATETAAPPATIPADGNPEDVTCKGSYTVSDEDVVAAMDTVIATMGEDSLTNGELQVYYWLQVQQFLAEYSYYASYVGLDYTQPLDTQVCLMDETGKTWQQFFLAAALENWRNYQALSNESLAQGYEIDPEVRAELDGIADTLKADAIANGFENAESWFAHNVGPGASIADYSKYLELYHQGYVYFEDLYNRFQPTDAELEAYFAEHEEGYAESGITKEGSFVDVRHILIMPEGADTSNIRTETFPEEAWAAAKTEAEAILAEWKSGEATEESFAQLANTRSADSDGTDGGLYSQVTEGQMVEAFNNWIFDEARQYGDVEIVETEFGYHIMFFVSGTPQWKYYAESDYIGEKVTAEVLALAEAKPMEVDYSAIKLGLAQLG